MDVTSMEQFENFLLTFLDTISEQSMWGWDARPNGAFLVIQQEDAAPVQGFLQENFE